MALAFGSNHAICFVRAKKSNSLGGTGSPETNEVAEIMKRYLLSEVLMVTLALLLAVGCSKAPASVEAADGTSQQLPFDQGNSGHSWFGSRSASEITVPAGTPIEVRMQSSLSSATASSGQEFEAVLDEPLVVNGKAV